MQYSSTLKAETTAWPNGVLTSNRCFIAREFEESSKMRTQMMVPQGTGALINDAKRWQSIDWNAARREVRRLQMRIAKAVRETNSRATPQGSPFEMLEPYEGKLSRTVLRGERGGNAPDLPGPMKRAEIIDNAIRD